MSDETVGGLPPIEWPPYYDCENEMSDWQTCPACGRRFDAADDTGLGFGGCPESNCAACEKCCTCEEGSGD